MLSTDFENLRELYRKSDVSNLHIVVKNLITELSNLIAYDNMYFHPLGFMYATLHSFSNNETIRIHIWNKRVYELTPILDIHNHYYKVNSYVFCGCVVNQLYKIHGLKNPNVSQYKGSYTSNGGRILTKTTDGFFVIEEKKSIHYSGDLYVIEHDQIHSGGSLGDETTCTVVYTQEPGEKEPLVFGKGELPDVLLFELKKVPSKEVKKVLTELKNLK
ncbi:hypothetical protein [Mucilaginibacter lacusdianchii]|uniref:hypothetical protein n=1 Tax=Mucilaginibacter lacusdianchii TaxID=2684211 RepID=UPI00131B175D|nr:hypothetical protein [Mucilaginibacter sp. JXJ CY 39]